MLRWYQLECGHFASDHDPFYKQQRGRDPGLVECKLCSEQWGSSRVRRIVRLA